MAKRILILGAGVCGLAAAWRLLERDPSLEITLLEKEDRPGGLARSLTVDGLITDLGPHRIFTELPDVKEFLQDIAGDQLETVRRKSRMWLRGGWVEYPPKPAEMIRHLGLATLGAAGMSYLANKATGLLGNGEQEESFASLMRDAFGPDLYRILVGPYAEKVWKVPAEQIHGDIARVRVSAGGLDQMVKKVFVGEPEDQITAVKEFFYLPGGVESLVKKLRDGIESRGATIKIVRNVTAIRDFRTGHLQVTAINGETEAEESLQAEAVISTIPIDDLLGMLLVRHADISVAAARTQMRYINNFLVCLVVNRPRVTDCQWLYFPGRDTVFNRAYEPANFHASMGAKGKSMIVFEITAQQGDKTDRRTDAQLLEATLRGVERVGLLTREDITASLVHRIPRTYPFYDTRYRERLGRAWKYLERFPNLISAGRQGLFLHNNMDHSIHMGFRAAERLVEGNQNPAKAFYGEVRRFQQFRIVD